MALIDFENKGRSNETVQKMVRANNLVPNKFWIGDVVHYTIESKSRVLDKYDDNLMWSADIDSFKIKPNTPLVVKAIHKHDTTTPWWYLVESKEVNRNVWIVEDGLSPMKPNYSPKKTQRTLESMGKPSYRFKTEKEFLEEYGEYWRSQLGYAVFVRQMDYLLGEEFPYDIEEVPGAFELRPKESNDRSGLYTWNITKTMLTIDTPSYKPRRTERTLEANNSFRDAREITILIRDLDDFELVHGLMKENGYTIYDGIRECIRESNEPINIFINLETGEITQSILSSNNWTKSPIYDGVWERILTTKDLPYIKRILEAGRIIPEAPSYTPKRTIRKLDEAVLLDYLPTVPPILTQHQQRQQYKKGDVVYIRPDAFDYFYDVNPDMEKWLGKSGKITDIILVEDIYDVYDDRGKGMRYDDLLLTLKLPYDRNTYFWFYRCLVNLEFAKPSYKPRKVDRSIEEGFRNDYDISSEKYQEKFGKPLPSLIPIGEIETFYDVKFEDYCNDLYPELNESVWLDNFKDKQKQLSSGKYSCIIFNITTEEEHELFQYLKDMEIISEIDLANQYLNFIILTKPYKYLNTFQLYNYSGVVDIRTHMHNSFQIPIDEISPIMSLDELKMYMNRILVKSAKDMYTPKKTDRSI